MLQRIDAFAVGIATGDGFVHHIPSLDFSATGFHHSLDPLVHGINQSVVTLFVGQRDGAWHIDIVNLLGNSTSRDIAACQFLFERRHIGALQGSVLDLLHAVHLEAHVVEIVVVGIGQLVQVEGDGTTRIREGARYLDGLPLRREGDSANAVAIHKRTGGSVPLCRCLGTLVGSHVGAELILGTLGETTCHDPELIVPHLVHLLVGLHLEATTLLGHFLAHHGLREGDVLDIDIAHEVSVLQQEERIGKSVFIDDVHLLPLGREGDIGRYARAPVTQLAVDGASLRTAHSHRHLISTALFGWDIVHSDVLHIPRISAFLSAMHLQSVGSIEGECIAVVRFTAVPAHVLLGAEILTGNGDVHGGVAIGQSGCWFVLNQSAQPSSCLL